MQTLIAILAALATAAADVPAAETNGGALVPMALRALARRASDGHADAQVSLARAYLDGRGAARDPAEALRWFEAAAVKGNAEARFFAGSMLLMGIGSAKDATRGLSLLTGSAEQGMTDAQVLLGLTYLRGRDARRDLVQADAWFQLAAARGDPLAPAQCARVERQMSPEQLAEARARVAAFRPAR